MKSKTHVTKEHALAPGTLVRVTTLAPGRNVRKPTGEEAYPHSTIDVSENTLCEIIRILNVSFYDDGWGYLVWLPVEQKFVGLEYKDVKEANAV